MAKNDRLASTPIFEIDLDLFGLLFADCNVAHGTPLKSKYHLSLYLEKMPYFSDCN